MPITDSFYSILVALISYLHSFLQRLVLFSVCHYALFCVYARIGNLLSLCDMIRACMFRFWILLAFPGFYLLYRYKLYTAALTFWNVVKWCSHAVLLHIYELVFVFIIITGNLLGQLRPLKPPDQSCTHILTLPILKFSRQCTSTASSS